MIDRHIHIKNVIGSGPNGEIILSDLDLTAVGIAQDLESRVYRGENTERVGRSSETIGLSNLAIGAFSFASGVETRTEGNGSHTEGRQTVTVSDYSHSEGIGNCAIGVNTLGRGSDFSERNAFAIDDISIMPDGTIKLFLIGNSKISPYDTIYDGWVAVYYEVEGEGIFIEPIYILDGHLNNLIIESTPPVSNNYGWMKAIYRTSSGELA